MSVKPTLVPSRALHHQNVIAVSCGAGHSFALVSPVEGDPTQNIVYSWGKCNFGQLGHGEEEVDKSSATHIVQLDNLGVVGLGAGDAYGLAVTHMGSVYSWGCGFGGGLGHGNESHLFSPKKIEALSPHVIRKVTAGKTHTLGLSDKGEVFVWGTNKSGQLGIGSNTGTSTPKRLGFDKIVREIACGESHTLILTEEGTVYGFGSNSKGQLGIPSQQTPQSNEPLPIKLEEPILNIGCGLNYSWAIDKNNHLWMWGDNIGGQLALIETPWDVPPHLVMLDNAPLQVKRVSGTQYATICESLQGTIYTWGELFLWQDTVKDRQNPLPQNCTPKESRIKRRVVDMASGCNHFVVALSLD
eukprot:TRINITY_DN12593_c0_g1_i1.p1 TRINITY_DN12593_c0_g1~~TRINITY_DN12593_c0_g1_i1.p1  ORF type:complete len:396 (+),score=54.04 TRINITY_DN12593_c0_g1_i1:118-1188(+)